MAKNKPLKTNISSSKSGYSWYKMAMLFFLFICGSLIIGLIQASLVSKGALVSRFESYVNFANPTKRFVYIYPGMRREEIVEKYSKILNWDARDERWFIASTPPDSKNGGYHEGYFLSKSYFVDKDASGKEVGEMMHDEFLQAITEKVLNKPDDNAEGTRTITAKNGSTEIIDLDTAIRIASIIQREAEGPHDMPLVSGIIWNRIFLDMKLDLDATLQYVKGDEKNWWPQVVSKDKFLDSPYNTYKYKGVPPGAISNPSTEAINAVYNPQKTDCLFYLHDKKGDIHCTKTYREHKNNIDTYLR